MKKLFRIGQADHGRGKVIFRWQPEGNLLATAGGNALVHIFDRHGEKVDEFTVQGSGHVLDLAWDHEGECLAVLEQGSGVVLIWDQGTRSVMPVDTNMKELTYMIWSRTGPQLAIGTEKGNLLMYNKLTHKKIPVMGKHSKRIISGAWSKDNTLTLGSLDCSITLSEEDGTTVEQALVKYVPIDMKFAPRSASQDVKGTTNSNYKESTVSLNMNGKSLLLHNINDPENPIELAFQEKYGKILTHEWWSNGYLLISFSAGFLVVISTQLDEIGEERFSERYGRNNLVTMAYSAAVHRAAVAEARALYIVDLKDYQELKKDAITLSENDGQICGVEWSPDGQILSVGTTEGSVFNYLARMPILHASYGTQVALLSSLREVTVVPALKGGKQQEQGGKDRQVAVTVTIEPYFLGLGRNHIGVGMNSRAVFYRLDGGAQVADQEYHGSVESLYLNDGYAAAFCASTGQVVLHTIEGSARDGDKPMMQRKTLPEREESFAGGGITCVALTDNFLIYGTAKGTVEFFFLPEWAILSGAEMRHGTRIKSICPNFLGTKVVVADTNNTGVLYCPTSGDVLPVPMYPAGASLSLWDQRDRNVFFVSDGTQLHTYVHAPTTMAGGTVTKVGQAKINKEGGVAMEGEGSEIPQHFVPIVAYGGAMTCQLTSSGAIGDFVCLPYERVSAEAGEQPEVIKQSFLQNLSLLRLKAAWKAALQIDTPHYWLALCNKAMEVLDIDMAIQVYRQLGDAGMVMGLERIAHVEDKNLLAGHMALLFCDYPAAQDLFLSSSRPISALEMRRDLLHWDQALKLARTLAPQDVPGISVEYGQQLEFKGDYEAALGMYEGALRATDSDGRPVPASNVEQAVCMSGIARCTLRMGDVRRGVRLAKESGDKQLYRECAGILEDMKQLADAAAMFELGEQYDRAAALHLTNRNLAAAAAVIQYVTLPKLLTQYAKACEAAEKWRDARDAYERARDLDSVVRLCLEQLDEPEKAFEIVRSSSSSAGAEMVSKYCQGQGDWRGAIQFLLMAKRHQEAFALASSHEQMAVFTSVLGEGIGADDAVNVARYYEKRNDLGNAGRFFSLCGQYHRALKLFLHCGEKEVDAAIAVVGKARNDMLTHTLIDFLMGETDGVPKDPNYIYRLYMALGNFTQAAKTAIIIARQEQDLGNYKVAHGILYETIRQLEGQRTKVPQSLRKSFVLLHSYILVKKRALMNDHMGAARMLLRVASNISKFPVHVVPILTSTVIECQRAGLKNSAFEYASMLMRAEYRGQVKKELRRNIEAIVRRPNREEESEETSPCPISGVRIPATSLECPTTKDQIPMCVITGRHMEKEDWCLCPVSRMPALLSAYKEYLEFEHNYRLKKKLEKKGGAGGGGGGGGKEGEDDDAVFSEEKEETRLGVYVGTDPVFGKKVSTDELKKSTNEEVDDYIKEFNLVEREEGEGGAAGGAGAGGVAATGAGITTPVAGVGGSGMAGGPGGGGGGGGGEMDKRRDQ